MANETPTPESTQEPVTPAARPPSEAYDANINVADYLHGQGLDLAHVGYSDEHKGIAVTAKDQDGKLYELSEKSIREELVKSGHLGPDSKVNFQPGSYNSAETALNEVPTGLSYGEQERLAWGTDAGAADLLVKKYGPERVKLSDDNKAVALQDIDGVWRKVAPDFHDDTGSWNWSNFVNSFQRHQKTFAELAAFSGGARLAEPAIMEALAGSGLPQAAAQTIATAGGSVAGGALADVNNFAMGRIIGTTGEDPLEAAKSMALHGVINAVLPGAADAITEKAVLPILKGSLKALGGAGQTTISTVSRLLSMFGDGNATAVEHSITHAAPVSEAMDAISGGAESMMQEAVTNGRALNKYDAVQQAAGAVVNQAGQAFAGGIEDAGRLTRNLNGWMNRKTSELVGSLDKNVVGAMQQNIPVSSIKAGNEFRNFLGTAGIPVNAAGRVTANDLAASFGTMTPEEASTAAKAMNLGMATLQKLSKFDATDPSAFKDMANMHAAIESMKGLLSSSSMAPEAIQQATKHLDNVGTVMSSALPVSFRSSYTKLMQQYANAAHATNFVTGSALASGSSETMASAGDRVAQLLTQQQAGSKTHGALFDALMEITPGSQALKTNLQTALSAKYMYTFSSAPTSTIGGALARTAAMPFRAGAKNVVTALGKSMTAADATAVAIRNASNSATQIMSNHPAGQGLKQALSSFKTPGDFLDGSKVQRVVQMYGNYKVASDQEGQE